MVALCGSQVVGVAVYHRSDRDLVVTDVGIDLNCECPYDEVLGALIGALELACLAGGARRLVVRFGQPAAAARAVLEQRGYLVRSGEARCWAEKCYPA